MIHSVRFTCVLDTNVIYPIDIRDLLFWFAHYDLFTPKWSKHIFKEWIDVMRRKEIPENEIAKIIVNKCYEIHVKLGPGLLESVYEEILYYELLQLGLKV